MTEKIIPPQGFLFSGIAAGIKKNGKKDLGLILAEREATAAAVFTTNLFQAAPVVISKQRVKRGRAIAVLVNSGNANAGTGKEGELAALKTGKALAGLLKTDESKILLASTGVIGEPLPANKIIANLPALIESLDPCGFDDFEQSIMTTDTRKKIAHRNFRLNGKKVRVIGFAKGAGMIQPLMATMLGFVLTDAAISGADLQKLLKQSADLSFNRVTIDGDTSTNDTLFALASGASGVKISQASPGFARFQQAFEGVCSDLAGMIAADGEGASRWFSVIVRGARTGSDAEKIARRIANSPLVKTAISASDPNWGRIIAAAGIAGPRFDVRKTSLHLVPAKGGSALQILKAGARSPGYRGAKQEKQAAKILGESGFKIIFDLGAGKSEFEILTCDFTEQYVRINADYRS
jgi:glutamate N-acetyltransferase / amino-acid N-acetyltransferase